MTLLKDSGVSKVYRSGDWVYKRQPKFMTDNEIWILEMLLPYGYVPRAERVGVELIKLEYIKSMLVINPKKLKSHIPYILSMLKDAGIRHGDLTDANIIIGSNDHPYIIDWSESRLSCDPRPDKRPEGDEYWLTKAMERICTTNERIGSGR